MIHRLWEIFLVKCQKQTFSFNKREAKVYCYAFLHVLTRDTCIKHEQLKKMLRGFDKLLEFSLASFLFSHNMVTKVDLRPQKG
jgi:hypothetical protein